MCYFFDCRKQAEGQGGEGGVVHGAGQSTHAAPHAPESLATEQQRGQLVVVAVVERGLAERRSGRHRERRALAAAAGPGGWFSTALARAEPGVHPVPSAESKPPGSESRVRPHAPAAKSPRKEVQRSRRRGDRPRDTQLHCYHRLLAIAHAFHNNLHVHSLFLFSL